MRYRTTFIAYLLTIILAACADGSGSEQAPALMSRLGDAQSSAESILYKTLAFDSAVHGAFGRVKDDIKANDFALFDEIGRSLDVNDTPRKFIVESAADEILEQMLMTEEPELAARVYGLVSRFAELERLPREGIPVERLGDYLDDSIKVAVDIQGSARVSDDEARKQIAYYFAPAYNFVVSTHIFALAAAGYVRSSIENSIRDEIETNQHLIGSAEAGDRGYLSDWVVSQTPGSLSAAKKLDNDPILYSIRRSLDEQQQALE